MNCTDFRKSLPDLLLDPESQHGDARIHLQNCTPCGQEYAAFQSTFSLLDSWQAPKPSAYFDQKLAARLREEATATPAGWFERLRAQWLFNTGAQFRPMLAGALAAVLLVGGGTYAGLSTLSGPARNAQVSAAVSDLQILDKNDQALQQMDQLLQDDQTSDDDGSIAPKS